MHLPTRKYAGGSCKLVLRHLEEVLVVLRSEVDAGILEDVTMGALPHTL